MSFSPILLGSGLGGYAFLTRTREKQQHIFEKSPQVARETERALEKLGKLQTSDELLDDFGVLKVALGAFGLDSDIGNRAFIKKVLDSDPADRGSFANRLSDKRYLALAQTFGFAGPAGPSLPAGAKGGIDVDLAGIRTAEDLLGDGKLLRSTLAAFGLEKDAGNTQFLKAVLTSDPADDGSFANRLSDKRYVELARAVNLAGKVAAGDTIYDFASLLAGREDPVRTFDELAAEPELLEASLKIFGLERDGGNLDFLAGIMNSDLDDATSPARQAGETDARYLALARAFGFHDRAVIEGAGNPYESRVERLVNEAATAKTRIAAPEDLFKDPGLMLATFAFFDLPHRANNVSFADRILRSDPDDPTSLVNVTPDSRYRAFAEGFGLARNTVERTYPSGFAKAIVANYVDRQFEIAVGEQDSTLRFAVSLERELATVVKAGKTNDANWFGVMASKPLREVFETVFQLPSSFGTLDVDRQLVELKKRSEMYFGTKDLAALAEPDRFANLRKLYLVQSEAQANASDAGSIAMMLLGRS